MAKKQILKKKILSYFAVFEPERDGSYSVSFPNFPGCVTFGHNFEEARKMAEEVLSLWLEELTARSEEIPETKSRPIIDEVRVAVAV